MINRRMITLVLLCTSIVVVVAAQMSFRRPGMWRWLQAAPAATSTFTEMPSKSPSSVTGTSRRAPYPIATLLAGAADQEPFLAPARDALPEWQASAKAEKDAEARYHLLSLAKDATSGSLESDARNDVRYQSLIQKPDDNRGELIHIRGDLISISEPMELHRPLPGIAVCYLALMTDEQSNFQYLVMFTDLPENLKDQRPRWNELHLSGTQFSGYFYKVAKFTSPRDPGKTWQLPVLVGKSPILPLYVEALDNWVYLLIIFLAMGVPVILIALILPRWFKKGDADHLSLMRRFESRREERAIASLEMQSETGLRKPDDQG